MPAEVRAALEDVDEAAANDNSVDLRWVSNVNRFFHLSESVWQTAARPWWDFLAMTLAMHYEIQAAPSREF